MATAQALAQTQTPVDAVRSLYLQHGARVRQTLARLAPMLDAEDLLHETFVIALERADALRRARQPQAWLFGVAVKLAATRRRSARVRRFFGLDEVSEVAAVDTPGRTVEQRDAQRRVQAALESLSDAQREVFVLFELQGLSGEEVAEACGIPVKTVWTRLFHARKSVSAALERALLTESRTSGLSRDEVRP